jgi:hypothetical protein
MRAILLLGLLLGPSVAQAGDFFDLEPGPRIKGHAGLDCKKCHSDGGGGGVERNKCLGCHDHRELKQRIDAGKGLHARPDFNKGCEKCHIDHKGEKARAIDWRQYGGMENFPHDLTGYDLQGAHKRLKCADCHKDKFEKTGTPRLLGLEQKCLACHKDVHNFQATRKELTDCNVCHSYDARAISSQTQIARTFNHAKVSEYPLRGAHDDIACVKCHTGSKVFKMQARPQNCASCHKDIHRNVYTAQGRTCDKCHFEDKASWKDFKFDHSKTSFPLTFTHTRAACIKCHPSGQGSNPTQDCMGCHRKDDVHIINGVDRFEKVACHKCHTPSGFKNTVAFNHATETSMKLQGRHGEVGCTTCHRARPRKDAQTAEDAFERFRSPECMGCHVHANAHDRAFNGNPGICVKCHVPGTDNLKLPPHDKLSNVFAQAGAHGAASCEKCHGEGLKNLKLGADCSNCHKDVHNKTLGPGADCKKCHTEGFAFSQVNFDHNKDTKYPLTGRHASVTCNKCHQKAPASYAVEDKKCVTCHGGQDIHVGKLGADCEKCHTPAGGAPLFNHNKMTRFALEDAHLRAQCVGCHTAATPAKDGRPVVDWTFKTQGRNCKDCHGDKHGVSAVSTCARCHGTLDWRTRIQDRYHDVPPFSLLGQHGGLECTKCHGQSADLTGMGTRCETCHRQDDIHGGALRECQQCHRVQGWLPSSFTHVTTGFPLQGVHRVLDCRQCHGTNIYSGMSSECISCHLNDFFRRSAVVYHQGIVQDPNCLPCHNQVSWQRSPLKRRLP